MTDSIEDNVISRREFLRGGVRGAALVGLGWTTGLLTWRSRRSDMVWQIDPDKCVACGNCATYCVLQPSAVKCAHAFHMCGYCKRCFGYFEPQADQFSTAAENQLCPTGAITRKFTEEPYYEYTIDESLCMGCGKCVKGCTAFGNGSLFLQVRHDICVNCNECAIAAACPADAHVRIPADRLDDWLREKGRKL
jgi:electron transport complex protein RnfB